MRSTLACSIVLAGLAATAPARAESKADQLFAKGKKLLADKKYEQACTTFEEVDKLDPGIGAKLNVAKCYEEWGKLAKAFDWYSDAERMARESSDKRAGKIKELVETLDSDVPRLTVKLPEKFDAKKVTIRLDGQPLTEIGVELRVDPGAHVIEYDVAGETRKKTVPLDKGEAREVTLEIPSARPRTKPGGGDDEPGTPGRWRSTTGLVVGSAGVIGLGVAGYLTLDARSSYNDALDTHCMGAKDQCSDEGLRLTDKARSRANVATIITAASLVAVGAGVYLFVSAPKRGASAERAVYVVPSVGPDGGGIVLGGGF